MATGCSPAATPSSTPSISDRSRKGPAMLDDTTKDFAAHWPADRSLELIEETAASSLAVRATADPDHLALVGWDQAGRERRLAYQDLDRAPPSLAGHPRGRP